MMILNDTRKTIAKLIAQFVMIGSLAVNAALATPVETELHAEQWELSRNGERLLGIDGIAGVVKEWASNNQQKIELQYPGGEEGELWVHQLMDWLVALGIPSTSLVAVPGSGQGDIIRLRVIRSGDNFR
jgi:hypothetical protein